MKKQVMMWILAVSVVIFPGVSTVRADVLYFDDIITGVGDEIVPNGYGGFSWTDVSNRSFYVTNSLPQFAISGDCCIYTKISQIARPDERQFNFDGVWMAASSQDNLSVWVQGYSLEGIMMFSENITLSSTTSQWYDFNFTGIYMVAITALNYVVLDDFTYSLVPVVLPRGEVVVDFDDRWMGGSETRPLPLGFKGILWDESVWVVSETNYSNSHQGESYAMPHSGDKFIFNQGQGYATLGFSFDPNIYPEAVLLGSWFSRVQEPLAGADEVRFVGYDETNQVIAESNWLTLTDEPQYLEAIDAATGEPFGYATRLEVEYTASLPDGYGKFAMDDVTFLSDPIVLPVAEAGGPYMARATDWNGGWVELDGSASQAQGQATLVGYEWDLDISVDSDSDGDPGNDADANDVIVETFFGIGQTSIALVVTDDMGEKSQPDITTVTVSSTTVVIDIKPGSDDNTVVFNSKGSLPVAFLTDASFDAATIDPTTVTLRGRDFADGLVKVAGKKKQKPLSKLIDVDEDGDLDLVVKLDIEKLTQGDVEAECEVGGLTYDGYVVSGTDTIRIIQRK